MITIIDGGVVLTAMDGAFWVRFGKYGPGISIINKVKHPPLFSERNGYRKVYRIWKYGIEMLKPLNRL